MTAADFQHPEQPMALTDYEDWTTAALAWIREQPASFTADDLRSALPQPPHQNLVGGAFNSAVRQGLIVLDGYRRSTSASRKQSLLRVWRTAA